MHDNKEYEPWVRSPPPSPTLSTKRYQRVERHRQERVKELRETIDRLRQRTQGEQLGGQHLDALMRAKRELWEREDSDVLRRRYTDEDAEGLEDGSNGSIGGKASPGDTQKADSDGAVEPENQEGPNKDSRLGQEPEDSVSGMDVRKAKVLGDDINKEQDQDGMADPEGSPVVA